MAGGDDVGGRLERDAWAADPLLAGDPGARVLSTIVERHVLCAVSHL